MTNWSYTCKACLSSNGSEPNETIDCPAGSSCSMHPDRKALINSINRNVKKKDIKNKKPRR
jgi:hypothetical protein